MNKNTQLKKGDCLEIMKTMEKNSIDLVYLDPPFFTQKIQKLKTRDRLTEFRFKDIWSTHHQYAEFIYDRINAIYSLLNNTGNLFFHCDKNASHIIRAILDDVFGCENFRSEIIWYYKRWSNSKKGLLPAHQTIYFYSKSADFTFNTLYQDYSSATNVDQILQKRTRDRHGKSVYARTDDGTIILGDSKKGVPLSDVWDIPYLNPKARERVGYPTQKPLLLLERIITIASNPGDCVLDPFCGSGTTLVAARRLERKGIGIDVSEDALQLCQNRLDNPIRSGSRLLANGRESYQNADASALNVLEGLDYIPVQRNKGIDCILRQQFYGTPVPVRVQRSGESFMEAVSCLHKAAKKKMAARAILVKTNDSPILLHEANRIPNEILVVESVAYSIEKQINTLLKKSS